MKNTKENRVAFLKECFNKSFYQKDGDLMIGAKKLNDALSKKRQVVLIKDWSELGSELRFELESELRFELRSELWSEFWSEFGSELRSELRSELWSELGFEYYENVFLIFIKEFYPQLKTIQRNKKKIEALEELVNQGNCYIFISEKELFILPLPEEIKIDNQKRLHSETQYALRWLGKESYWLYGRKFEKSLWERAVKRKISAKELLEMKNIEQRMTILQIYGNKWLLENLNAKLIDKSSRGNELYLVDKVFREPAYFLKYKDSSTDRVYVSGIAPDFAKTPYELTADNAMAWKFQITPYEYKQLRNET